MEDALLSQADAPAVGPISIASFLLLAIGLAFGVTGLAISLVLIRDAPVPAPQAPCLLPNLTLDGAAVGFYNETQLANVTTVLSCGLNQTRLGLHRPSTGLTLGGQCVDIPSGIIMLPDINPANVTCGPPGNSVLSIAQLTREGLGFNGSCLAILTNASVFGGDTTGIKSNLQLVAVGGGASSCGGGTTLCGVTHDAKGRIISLVNGPAVLLANATAGGGATGPINNLSLSIIGTANQFVVTKFASGLVQLGLVQPLCPACSPSFSAMTLTLVPLAPASGGSGLATAPIDGQTWIGTGTGFALGIISGTANQIIVTPGPGSLSISTPQDLAPTSSPTFLSLSLTAPLNTLNGGTGISSAPVNGNVLIGDGDSAFTLTSITGTVDQVSVTPGAGTITLSAPQDLATGSAVTFAGVTFTSALLRTSGGTGNLGPFTDGQTIIGQTSGGNWVRNAITAGTGFTVTNGAGAITLSIGQAIATGSAVTFSSLTLTAPLPIASGGLAQTTNPAAGQLLIGNGVGYTLALLTTVSAQITITSGAGTINLALPALITAAIVGSSYNYGVLQLDVKGRAINRRNDTMYGYSEQTLTVTDCFSTSPANGQKNSKIVLNAGLGAVVTSFQSNAVFGSNAAGCFISISANPVGYRPVATVVDVISTARRNSTHSLITHLVMGTGTGSYSMNPYTLDGNLMYSASGGFPINVGSAFSIQQITTSFLTTAP